LEQRPGLQSGVIEGVAAVLNRVSAARYGSECQSGVAEIKEVAPADHAARIFDDRDLSHVAIARRKGLDRDGVCCTGQPLFGAGGQVAIMEEHLLLPAHRARAALRRWLFTAKRAEQREQGEDDPRTACGHAFLLFYVVQQIGLSRILLRKSTSTSPQGERQNFHR
jgi:hypothetical protein